MTLDEKQPEKWFSLKRAAQQLGVHETTLRRWADEGRIAFMTTAGGHRRFGGQAIAEFVARREHSAAPAQEWASRAITHAREDVAQHQNAHWLQAMDVTTRERHRLVGRKLMGVTLQYVSAADADQTQWLEEARGVGREYGQLSKDTGVPLRAALEAALFFRDRLLEATWELPARAKGGMDRTIDRRINILLNTVQLAITDVYEGFEQP
jgi:excisionase family DNA binding protein